ncbi:MAG: efflux RND transporter permease subunit, partial [Alphaproteobacteria bacterium]|nr:efflux RND transporter permease subunit [Alphaproteobacteria bacterium]
MNIARRSIERPLPSWIIILVCLAGGVWGFLTLGRLEDPAFTIKQAVVETHYPGASAQQVAREVSEPLESAIQKLAEVERIQSINRPGVSSIEVHIDSRFAGSELPAIWTRLRARVEDAARQLPSGVEAPEVNDSFGDVFGLYYAVTAEGFADAEKHRLATFLRRELLAVEGVADVSVRGLPEEAIFVEPNLALAVNLTVAPQIIAAALANANSVVDAGSTDTALIAAPAGSDTVSEIAGLSIGVGGDRINLADLAEVSRGRQSDPDLIVRFNGIEAFTIGIAGLATENIVAVGKRVEQRLATLQRDIPIGVELHPIYRQHLVVEAASND